jgi:hypothetical protein
VGDLFDGYQVDAAWDEVLAAPDTPHPAARLLYDTMSRLSASDLADRSAACLPRPGDHLQPVG